MLSMTGFGTGEAAQGEVNVAVELRSVNHRYLDIALKLPMALNGLESEMRALIKGRVARGRISGFAQVELSSEAVPVVMAPERLNQGVRLLKEAAARLGEESGQLPQPIRLEHLLAIPDLLQAEEPQQDEDDLRQATLAALTQAVDRLHETKEREGRELAAEMDGRLAKLREHLSAVEKLVPQAVAEGHQRLQTRIEQLLGGEFDAQRLAQEAAVLADRANINEECERLAVHIESFQAALSAGGQVAKRMNFLLQEMHREVNTMGSKTNLMDITQLVIAMKEEVESMREQIQNLE